MVRQSNIQKVLDICLRYKPSKVLLFGSSARGPVEDANDIDLVFYAQTETLPLATWADLIKDIGNGGVEDHVDLVLAETVPSHVLQEWEAYGRVLFQTGTQPTPVPSPLPAAARPIDPHLQEINHLVDELHLFSDNGGTLARLGAHIYHFSMLPTRSFSVRSTNLILQALLMLWLACGPWWKVLCVASFHRPEDPYLQAMTRPQ